MWHIPQCHQAARDLAIVYRDLNLPAVVVRHRSCQRELTEMRNTETPDPRKFDEHTILEFMEAQRTITGITDSLAVDREHPKAVLGLAQDISVMPWELTLSEKRHERTLELHRMRFSHPDQFSPDKVIWSDGIKADFEDALSQCSALVGTPQAAAMLSRRSPWRAELLLHDEACRFT